MSRRFANSLAGELIRRVDGFMQPVSDPLLAITDVKKRQNCGDQNSSGDGNTQVCGNNNNNNGNDGGSGSSSEASNVSDSQGLSRTDKIGIGVGVGTGVIAIIGVVIAYAQCRRMQKRPKSEPDSVALEQWEYPSSPQQQQPHYGYSPPGRAELGG
jgi:hypothetical protein